MTTTVDKEAWITELANIIVREHGFTTGEARAYAVCLWPEGEDLASTWDGVVPSPREALEADMEYWEA